jgi:hypothetical protein
MFQEGSIVAFAVGLLVVYVLGRVLDSRLKRLVGEIQGQPPDGITAEQWAKLLELPETFGGLYDWLGLFERTTYYALFLLRTPELIIGWLIFKLGCYWGVWRHLIGVEAPGAEADADRLIARTRRGNALAKISLLGTIGNLLVAVVGILAAVLVLWALRLLGEMMDSLRR